jgi:hypothetical protein
MQSLARYCYRLADSSLTQDLALDPAGRDVHDVVHAVVVVGSRDVSKAEQFIKDACPQGGSAQQAGLYSQPVRAVGTYEEVYNDPVRLLSLRSWWSSAAG